MGDDGGRGRPRPDQEDDEAAQGPEGPPQEGRRVLRGRDVRARGEARRRQRDAQEGERGGQGREGGAEKAEQEGQAEEGEEVNAGRCCSSLLRSSLLRPLGLPFWPWPLGFGFGDAPGVTRGVFSKSA